MGDKPEGTRKKKPQFIVLCGPTGVGKSRVPKEIFGLNEEAYTKIEIDSLIVQNNFYRAAIHNLIKLAGGLIKETIDGKADDKKILLTNLFNQLYINVKKNIIPCLDDQISTNITCDQLHDKMLNQAINKNKPIVLEINGDKDFSWLLTDQPATNTGKIKDYSEFTNEHRETLRDSYDITFCYLSHPYAELVASNKSRFLEDMTKCGADESECNVRLGNFLLEGVYNDTIKAIFNIYEKLSEAAFFSPPNITVLFYKRKPGKPPDGGGYEILQDFDTYKKSFDSIAPIRSPSDEGVSGVVNDGLLYDREKRYTETETGTGGRKKQKAKSKKQKEKTKKKKAKSKKQKSKKYKKIKTKVKIN
jgi:hypothetical protein